MKEQQVTEQPSLTGYSWRPATPGDVPALARLYAAIDAAYETHWGGTEDDIRADFDEPGLEADQDTLLAVAPTGEIAALGWLMPSRIAKEEEFSLLWGATHPDHYRRGLGSTVLAWLEKRASQKFSGNGSGRPVTLRTATPDTIPDRMGLYERHGYRVVRSYYRMRRDLSTPIPERPLPDGIRIIPWESERDAQALQVTNAAFDDHWGSAPLTPEQWKLFVTGSTTFRREFSLMALDGGELAGACINRVLADEIDRTGIREGWIGTLGVLKSGRGRGIGTALLCESMRLFKAAGYSVAGLSVDTENLTGALGIYERLGFISIQRSLTYAKQLTPG